MRGVVTSLSVASNVAAHVLVAQRPLVGEAEVLRVSEDAVTRVLAERVPTSVVRPVPLQVVEADVLVLPVPEEIGSMIILHNRSNLSHIHKLYFVVFHWAVPHTIM